MSILGCVGSDLFLKTQLFLLFFSPEKNSLHITISNMTFKINYSEQGCDYKNNYYS